MAMTPYSGDPNVISKLGTTPQERGLTTEQFKAKFDEGLKEFVTWFNDTHKTEFDAHLADNAAHNGFVGQYQYLPNFTDFNELTTPGLYHGVISGEKLNEAVTATTTRRLTLQVTVNTATNVYQELYYQDSTPTIIHRRFYRQRKNLTDWLPWFEIKTSRDVVRGQGSPEGVISATVGTLYQRTDGGAGTTLYVKESGTGNTGWKAVQTGLDAHLADNTIHRRIILSDQDADSDLMQNGDIWIKYTDEE